jgi:hypothetical protein
MDWLALCIILIKDIYIMILPFSLQDMTLQLLFCVFTSRPTSLLTLSLYLATIMHYTVFRCVEHGAWYVQY